MTQPQKVGQYNFIKKLGAGRMAEVYLGRIEGAEGFQKPVAIKKILPELASDIQFVQSLIGEAKVGGQLHHRNIVEVYDFIRYGNDYCIIMEYVDGVDLGRILRTARRYRVRIPPAAALYIASQMCDGLDYAHSARGFNGEPLNIIHRDLKPSNVLISIKGGVKISDFGIARVMDQVGARAASSTGKLSFMYQSPEHLSGNGRLTAAADIYSVGVILFEMLTLEPLYAGNSAQEVLGGMSEDELGRRLALAQRQLPGSERILATALNPSSTDRYRTASLMADDLRRLLNYMKVDDPKERLVNFFSRLIRFVQEQGKRAPEADAAAEDWGGQEESVAQPVAPQAAAPTPGWEGTQELPPGVAYGGQDATSAEPLSPQAGGWQASAPGGYGSTEEAAPPDAWTGAVQPTAGYEPYGYGGQPAVEENTPPQPMTPTPHYREETRVGGYETVEAGYGEGPYNETADIPAQKGIDSTRLLSVGGPVPPGYSPPPQAPGADDSWNQGPGTAILQVPQGPESQEDDEHTGAVPARRSKVPLMAAAVVLVLAVGGGLAAFLKNRTGEEVVLQDQPVTDNVVSTPAGGAGIALDPAATSAPSSSASGSGTDGAASPSPSAGAGTGEVQVAAVPAATPTAAPATPEPPAPRDTPRPTQAGSSSGSSSGSSTATASNRNTGSSSSGSSYSGSSSTGSSSSGSSYTGSGTSGSSSSTGMGTRSSGSSSSGSSSSGSSSTGSSYTGSSSTGSSSTGSSYTGSSTSASSGASSSTGSGTRSTGSSGGSSTAPSGSGSGSTSSVKVTEPPPTPKPPPTSKPIDEVQVAKKPIDRSALKNLDELSSRAETGKLTAGELGTIEQLPRDDKDFSRAKAIAATHYKKTSNRDAYSKALADLLSLPENKYNPVYNLEMAEYQLLSKNYKECVAQVALVDRYKARMPRENYFVLVARMYEIEAKALEGQFNQTEDPRYLDKAISTWNRFLTHVKSNNDGNRQKMAEDYVAKLQKIRSRIE